MFPLAIIYCISNFLLLSFTDGKKFWGDEIVIYLFGSLDIYVCVSFLHKISTYLIPKYDFKLLHSQPQDMINGKWRI